MPLWAKIFIGLLVVGVIYRIGVGERHHGDDPYRPTPAASVEPTPTGGGSGGGSDDANMLAQYEAEYQQIWAQFNQCKAQMEEADRQTQASLMNGGMPVQAPCAENLPQWTAQAAYLEARIHRLKTGDTTSSLYDITGLHPHSSSPSSPSSPGSSGSNDGGISATERATRQGILGTTRYTDENGEEHDLPSHDYMYRDRNTGQFVGTDSPNPPDNQHDYEQLTPER
jgi:hypothetical protein